ncbi:MAG: hypothetical protein IKT34_00880 [Clostridia bacterium]|nr:hypothetical protein [Clostridia bacterium]
MNIQSVNGFKGIDGRLEFKDSISYATDMRNLYITQSGAMKKRPSVMHEFILDNVIDGLFIGSLSGRDIIAAASGGYLFVRDRDSDEAPKNAGFIGRGECMAFIFNGLLYLKTDECYKKYDGSRLSEVSGYVPTVAISCNPDGSGTLFEQINVLTPKRRQTFSGDGVSVLYHLSEKGVEAIESLIINGVPYEGNYSLDLVNDAVSFEFPPDSGLNNVEIIYRMPAEKCQKDRFFGCTRIMLFGGNSDGRAFLWGNENYPNYRFHSDLANGTPSVEYFPENAYTVIGADKINCIVQQYDRQLIFTENSAFYSYCELKTDALGNVISSFPVFSLNGSKGCLIETDGCVIDNRPVTLCDDGLNLWESTSLLNEKNATPFSLPIDFFIREILTDLREINMLDFQANRELWFIKSGIAYIYNYGNNAFYIYDGFGGSLFTATGSRMYYVSGGELLSFCYDDAERYTSDCIWESNFIKNSHTGGSADVLSLEADIYINGDVSVSFEISDSSASFVRSFEFNDRSRLMRIFMRPSLKRVMPFKITIRVSGSGIFALHGITIKTKQRERSKRHGILRCN